MSKPLRSVLRRLTATTLILLVGLAAASTLQAKTVYLEQVETRAPMMGQPGGSSVQKIWIDDGKIRMEDETSGMVTILRSDLGKLFLVQTSEKSYHEMSMEQLQAMASMGAQMFEQMGGGAEPTATVTRTDDTKKIGEWDATRVQVEIGGAIPISMTMWMSSDVPVDTEAWKSLAKLASMQGPLGDLADQMSEIEGFPVRQETRITVMGMKMEVTSELRSAKVVEAKTGRFDPPAGFKKVEGGFPMMPGPGSP